MERQPAQGDFSIEEVTDLDAVWPHLTRLFLGLVQYHKPWEQRQLRPDWESRWRDFIALGPDRLILMAWSGDRAAGYVNARFQDDYGLFEEAYGFIDDAFVEADFRGRGLGRALLARAEAWCLRRGATELRLSAASENDLGVGFWKRSGFRVWHYSMSKELDAGA